MEFVKGMKVRDEAEGVEPIKKKYVPDWNMVNNL
jgi:hypothetical protein